jgi:hypothetical protein
MAQALGRSCARPSSGAAQPRKSFRPKANTNTSTMIIGMTSHSVVSRPRLPSAFRAALRVLLGASISIQCSIVGRGRAARCGSTPDRRAPGTFVQRSEGQTSPPRRSSVRHRERAPGAGTGAGLDSPLREQTLGTFRSVVPGESPPDVRATRTRLGGFPWRSSTARTDGSYGTR